MRSGGWDRIWGMMGENVMAGVRVMNGNTIDQWTLNDIITRIVEVADPYRIILFGSAARGEMGSHSDVDLLVVADCDSKRRLTNRIYRRLYGVGSAVDAVVVSPRDIERYGDSHALVIKAALTDGRVVYESGCAVFDTGDPTA